MFITPSFPAVCIAFSVMFFLSVSVYGQTEEDQSFYSIDNSDGSLRLTTRGASHFAGLALHCIGQEYPNKPGHVMNDSTDVLSPRALHPAFYGCFDWHSSVHGHWMLVWLLKRFPDLPEAAEIRKTIAANMTSENLQAEADYFARPGQKSFERMYGWAWLLQLALELHGWDDVEGKMWYQHIQPLTDTIVARYHDFLPRQTYPIRTGVHPNTAFGLSFAWDYASALGNDSLRILIENTGRRYFLKDHNCPATWEPGGSDFLSPCLVEADFMRRILPRDEFATWFHAFLPRLPENLREMAIVADRTDGQIVHLDGLNLSRGWCLQGIAPALSASDSMKAQLVETARKHIAGTVPHIASGDYAGEHWLASFAVYAIGQSAKP
ncbi:MAG: DUF2891 domain-containing protein [Bacteroidia bacterium]